jgi:hypothetical protein
MPSFTVHLPPEGDENQRLLKATFIKDGFSRSAFSFGLFWLISKRLWISTVLFGLVLAGLLYLLIGRGLPVLAFVGISFLLFMLLALEGASLQRWRLKRRGWQEAGLVVARNQEDAERRFFDQLALGSVKDAASQTASVSVPATTRAPAARPNDVIGLFPDPGARG